MSHVAPVRGRRALNIRDNPVAFLIQNLELIVAGLGLLLNTEAFHRLIIFIPIGKTPAGGCWLFCHGWHARGISPVINPASLLLPWLDYLNNERETITMFYKPLCSTSHCTSFTVVVTGVPGIGCPRRRRRRGSGDGPFVLLVLQKIFPTVRTGNPVVRNLLSFGVVSEQ